MEETTIDQLLAKPTPAQNAPIAAQAAEQIPTINLDEEQDEG